VFRIFPFLITIFKGNGLISSGERNNFQGGEAPGWLRPQNSEVAITHNEIIESIAITARKTITIGIVSMLLKRFSAVRSIQ